MAVQNPRCHIGLIASLNGIRGVSKTRTWTTDLAWNNLRLTLSEVKLSSKVYSNKFQVKIRTAWGLQKGDLWQVKRIIWTTETLLREYTLWLCGQAKAGAEPVHTAVTRLCSKEGCYCAVQSTHMKQKHKTWFLSSNERAGTTVYTRDRRTLYFEILGFIAH